jgi:hypothetical protein
MNNIQQFIEQNTEAIEGYDFMNEAEKAQFEYKFQVCARVNKTEAGKFLREAEFYNYLLPVLYNSFYNDREWESFFLSEMEAMIKIFIQDPEKDEEGADNFAKLESMGLSKLTEGPFGKKLLSLLVKQIDHSDPYISHKFLALVANYWIASLPDPAAIDKLKSKLSDSNWQIRWLAYNGLSSPVMKEHAGDISIPFFDKIKYFFKNYFGDPNSPER